MPWGRVKGVHAVFPGGRGGLICGVRPAGAFVASAPSEVTCPTCRAFMKRHPDTFAAWKPPEPGQ